MAMAPVTAGDSPLEVSIPESGAGSAGEQPWPSPATAWYALAVLALALLFAQLDRSIFSMMIEMVKQDLQLSDVEMGLLLGPASVLFYVFVGIPAARLVDVYSRRKVLSIGIVVWSGVTALTGLVQSYGQLFFCRMLVGVGGSAHGPGTYSMMADYFPPHKLPRAIAGLQVGFLLAMSISAILGGTLVTMVAGWPHTDLGGGFLIRNWQWVLIIVGTPGLIVALLVWKLPEPARRGQVSAKPLPVKQVLAEIWERRGVYGPLFVGLAFSSIEAQGLAEWRVPFMIRTYGWTPQQIGTWSGLTFLAVLPLGLLLGTFLTEWLGKRHADAPVRTTAIVFALAVPCAVASPLMPTGELSIIIGSLSGVFGFAASVPQNAAIQTITPNQMRGQVTALYLFMFTVFGAMGSLVIATVTAFVVGDEAKLWLSMALTAAVLMPAAAFAIWLGCKPYAREMERLGIAPRPAG